MRIPDNLDILREHLHQQDIERERLPKCEKCDRPMRWFCYEVDGKIICEECLNDNHRKLVDDFVD